MGEIFRAERPRPSMAHTGERLSHGHSLETEVEHYHRYYMARHLCRGQRVLDIACGEGYGSALLAQVAASVVGVDVDADAVAHAAASYVRDNLAFRTGSATDIPLPSASIDVLVSFETLEHFVDHDRFMAEARRLLRPGGKLILSTPDRDIFSPPGSTPTEYHVHELTRAEFTDLLTRHFANCAFFSQRVLVGSAILRDDGDPTRSAPLMFERRGSTHIEMNAGLPRARYLMCVASDAQGDAAPGGLFIDTSNLADPTGRVAALEAELEQARQAHRAEVAETQRAHVALIERIDVDRRIQVAEIERGHAEGVAAAGQAADLRATELERQIRRLDADTRRVAREHEAALAAVKAEAAHRLAEREARTRHEMEVALAAQAHAHAHAQAHAAALLRQAEAERDAMRASTSWRVIAPAQRLAERNPRAARVARRGAKLAFWTATMQLGKRRRARRQGGTDLAILAATGLFDRDWYLAEHPDVAAAGADPVLHYYWTGAAAGFDPHRLFDTDWYRATYPDCAGRNPLAHYVDLGSGLGHDPHPLFEAARFLGGRAPNAATALEDYLAAPATANGLFDPALYVAEYPDAGHSGLDPLAFYAHFGAARGDAPHPLFDAAWYAGRHPGLAPADALAHYLRIGAPAGEASCALLEGRARPFTCGDEPAVAAAASPDASVIVPVYGHLFETYRCLCAVLWRSGGVALEVIVADDRPSAPVAPLLARFAGVTLRRNPTNLGFLRSCNQAAREARGRHLVFLNNDTEVGADWLAPLVALADADASVGMVGCKLLEPDGRMQEAGGIFRSDGWGEPYGRGEDADRGEFGFVRDVDCVTGACFLVPRATWEAVGGFDEAYAPAFYEEFDLAVALRQRGLRVVYQPASVVTHLGSASYGAETRDRQSSLNHARFCRKWAAWLATRSPPGARQFTARDTRAYAGVALVIDDRVPEPDRHAGGLTLFQYLMLLRDLGLKVVYCPADLTPHQPYTRTLQQRGIEVVHAPDTLEGWLSRNGREVDHVWIARPSLATAWLPVLRRETGASILYYTHDLHYLRELRRFELDGDWWARQESQRLQAEEFAVFATADVVMSPSAEEAEIVRAEVPTSAVRAIPPYLFASAAVPPPPPEAAAFADRHDIVFVGGFAHTPNVDAALWLAGEIFPLVRARVPHARLVILGDKPPPEVRALAGTEVEVTGYVPDLAPYYAVARMSLSPLRYGAGVKGKVVGSLQAWVPVVTTPIGAEGIGLRDGIDALVGGTAAEIAERAVMLFEDAALCARLAAAGEAVVRERFSVERARGVMRELFEV